MKVFVTGWAGYIGVHLVDILKQSGHEVTGCDLLLFEGCESSSFISPDKELRCDVRSLTARDLEGHDAVIHLAAISNDPMGALDPQLTLSVNRDGTYHVAKVAKAAGVPRFLFSGSCSIYGKSSGKPIDEQGELSPLSAYAQSKVESEKLLGSLADTNFCPTYLRNSTAYGYSPMFRTDLVVNNLMACALAYSDIRIKSDGTPWRPLVHCRDIARAFEAFLSAPIQAIFNKGINIGSNSENYQVLQIAEAIKAVLPHTKVVFEKDAAPDPRDYKVNFDLLYSILPNFALEETVKSGIAELNRELSSIGFSAEDFNSDKYIRLRTLSKRLDRLSSSCVQAAVGS